MNPHSQPHTQWDEDYYRLLGVSRGATLSEIASAYHQAKNAYSKDSPATYSLFTPEENQAMLAKLEKAYLTLSNIDKKRDYDRWLDTEFQGGESSPRSESPTANSMSNPPTYASAFGSPTSTPNYGSQATDMPTFYQNAVRPAEMAAQYQNTHQTTRPTSVHAASAAPMAGHSAPATAHGAHANTSSSTHTPEEPAAEVLEAGQMSGPHLKQIREKLGLTADDVCRITKIPSKFLKAIEGSRPEDLPARVYLQGFIKNLAKLYHLDPKHTVDAYLQSVTPPAPPSL